MMLTDLTLTSFSERKGLREGIYDVDDTPFATTLCLEEDVLTPMRKLI